MSYSITVKMLTLYALNDIINTLDALGNRSKRFTIQEQKAAVSILVEHTMYMHIVLGNTISSNCIVNIIITNLNTSAISTYIHVPKQIIANNKHCQDVRRAIYILLYRCTRLPRPSTIAIYGNIYHRDGDY